MARLSLSALLLALLLRACAADCPFDLAECYTKGTPIKECREEAAKCRTPVSASVTEVMTICASREQSNCGDVYKELTDAELERPSDPKQAEIMDRFMELDGLVEAAASKRMKCEGSPEECKAETKAFIESVKDEDISEDELNAMMLRMRQEAAGKHLIECTMTAGADEESCKAEAKQKAAQAGGVSASDVEDSFLKEAAVTRAEKDLTSRVRTCMETASDDANRMCHVSDDYKELVAIAMGEDKDSIKDSEVAGFIARGAEGEALTVVKACAPGEVEACRTEAQRQLALARGRPLSEVSRFDLEHAVHRALSREIVDLMEECVKDGESDCSKCREAAKNAIKEADMQGVMPDAQELEERLRDAGVTAAREVLDSCGCSEECRSSMKDRVGHALGMCGRTLADAEVDMYEEQAKLQEAADSMRDCRQAKEDNSEAVCETPYERFRGVCDASVPDDMVTAKTEEWSVNERVLRAMGVEVISECLDLDDTGDELRSCLARSEEHMRELLGGDGVSEEELNRKVQARRHEAEIAAVGEKRGQCIKSGESDCDRLALEAMQRLEMEEDVDVEMVKNRHNMRLLAGCEESACRQAQREAAVALGMDAAQYATLKRVMDDRTAAEAWSACDNSGEFEEADCDNQARAAYQRESGSSGSFDAERVRRLGMAIARGEEPVLVRRKRVDVTCSTAETTCSDDVEAKMAQKAKKAAEDEGKETTPIERPCRLVDGTAEYGAFLSLDGASDAEIEDLSAKLPPVLQGMVLERRLGQGRRLAEVTAAFAMQDMEECSPSDSSCMGLTMGVADLATHTSLAAACAFVGLAALVAAGL